MFRTKNREDFSVRILKNKAKNDFLFTVAVKSSNWPYGELKLAESGKIHLATLVKISHISQSDQSISSALLFRYFSIALL